MRVEYDKKRNEINLEELSLEGRESEELGGEERRIREGEMLCLGDKKTSLGFPCEKDMVFVELRFWERKGWW